MTRKNDTIVVAGEVYQRYIILYQATGGKISIEKSSFYHWKWDFVGGKLKLINIEETNDKLPLEQVQPHVGSRTLGMKLNINLEFKDAAKFIKDKMYQSLGRMKGSPLNSYEGGMLYRIWFSSSCYYGTEGHQFDGKRRRRH